MGPVSAAYVKLACRPHMAKRGKLLPIARLGRLADDLPSPKRADAVTHGGIFSAA